jgi:hypothetical protein
VSPGNLDSSELRFGWREWLALTAAFLVIAFALVFALALDFSGRPLPHGLQRPILAMEVPASADDIRLILGCGVGETRTVPCGDPLDKLDRESMRTAQYFDYFFIPCYTTLFFFTGLVELRTVRSKWRYFGIAAAVLVVPAAVLDYLEDFAILRVLDRVAQSAMPDAAAIARYGWSKWWLLFVVFLCLVPLSYAGDAKSMTLKIVSRLLMAVVVVNGLAGLIACWLRHPARLESASSELAAIPLLILFRTFLRDGTLVGLDRLAKWPVPNWLSRWPEFLFEEEEVVAHRPPGVAS